jgi:Protein of unknown function (DUF1573)
MRFILLLGAIVIAASCKEGSKKDVNATPVQPGMVAEKTDSTKFTTMQWIDSVKDYGKITEGQKLEVLFRFKNTGDKPLVIESVRPGCGCTVADPPKEPIAPGEEGEIKGSFDSNGKSGMQHKSIYIMANTKGSQSHEISFTVDVQKKQ